MLLVAENTCFFKCNFYYVNKGNCLPFLYSFRVKIPQMFSIGFMSQFRNCQPKTLTFCGKSHCFLRSELWSKALSCWNLHWGPKKVAPNWSRCWSSSLWYFVKFYFPWRKARPNFILNPIDFETFSDFTLPCKKDNKRLFLKVNPVEIQAIRTNQIPVLFITTKYEEQFALIRHVPSDPIYFGLILMLF